MSIIVCMQSGDEANEGLSGYGFSYYVSQYQTRMEGCKD